MITVFVVNTPLPLVVSNYDLETGFCWVLLNNDNLHLFIQVPRSQTFGKPNWITIKGNPEALLVGLPSNCPLELGQGGFLTI